MAAAPDSEEVEVAPGSEVIAYVLVDFDNLYKVEVPGPSELAHWLSGAINRVLGAAPATDTVRVRLYGGWFVEGVLSRRGSAVAAAVSQTDPFPLSIGGIKLVRGSIELARSLLADATVRFDDTYRRRAAAPRLRLAKTPPDGCSDFDGTNCPARILHRYSRSAGKECPTSECPVAPKDAFVVHEQKMVDTHLTCDLLQAVGLADTSLVVVVSDDSDFVPPLMYASITNRGSILSLDSPRNAVHAQSREELLQRGVEIWTSEETVG